MTALLVTSALTAAVLLMVSRYSLVINFLKLGHYLRSKPGDVVLSTLPFIPSYPYYPQPYSISVAKTKQQYIFNGVLHVCI